MIIEDNWDRVGKKFFCRIHLVTFENEKKCPQCYHSPSFPVELGKKSRGLLSERRTPLSKLEVKAFEMYKRGHSFSSISKQLKVSKSTAFGYVKKAEGVYKADKGVTLPNDKGFIKDVRTYKGIDEKQKKSVVYKGVRLHNDSVSLLIEPLDLSMERDCVQLKFSKYKLIKDYPNVHIQLFSKKIIFQFLEDIEGRSEDECFSKADKRVQDFLKVFKFNKVKFLNGEWVQVSRHYAIIGSDLAKHFIKEKKKVIIMNPDGKGVRARVDFSHRVPELDFENVKFNKDDSKVWTHLIKDSLENPIDLLSVTKQKIDFLQSDYVKANIEFTDKMNWLAENLKSHQRVLEGIEKAIDKLGKVKKRGA